MALAARSTARWAADAVGERARGVAPWVERTARVGYAAKALIYVVAGFLALRAAVGAGGRTVGSRGALREVDGQPFGDAVLLALAVGLLGYAAWRLIEAATDPEGHGVGAKGLALRASYVARGLAHAALALAALRLAQDEGGAGDDGQRATEWTARALAAPFGKWLVVAAGLGLAGYGLYQLWRGVSAKLSRQLDLARLTDEAGRAATVVARVGIAARGLVFAVMGLLAARAGWLHDAGEAAGVGEALAWFRGRPLGAWLLGAVALGLVAYGAYDMIQARYRRFAHGG